MTDTRRACIGCRGHGWIDTGLVDDWPTIDPCPECRPVAAARRAANDYRPDVPIKAATDAELARAEQAPRTALWPLAQLTEPPPGHRLSGPYPKTTERRNP